MSLECLIDHTGFHTLKPNASPPTEPSRRGALLRQGRALLQTIELLLLADDIWLADTESKPIIGVTRYIYGRLQRHGLTADSPNGFIHIMPVTPSDHEQVCKAAASDAYSELKSIEGRAWGEATTASGMPVRPQKVQPTDFPAVGGIPYDSDEAREFVARGMKEKDWTATASLVLLNWGVYEWFIEFHKRFRDPEHNAYKLLNTVFRWCINRQLAQFVSNQYPDKRPVAYAPALGRATQMAGQLVNGWTHSKRQLDRESANILQDAIGKRRWLQLQPALDITSPAEVPLLGYWFVQKIGKKARFDDIFQGIAELRLHENVTTYKEYLLSPDADTYGVRALGRRIRRELGLRRHSLKGKVSGRLRVLPYLAIELFVQGDLAQEWAHASVKEILDRVVRLIRYRALRRQMATVLLQMFPVCRELESQLIDFVASLNGSNVS